MSLEFGRLNITLKLIRGATLTLPFSVTIITFNGAHHLVVTSDPGANRTRNPQLRRLMLCPIELRGRWKINKNSVYHFRWATISATTHQN